MHRFTFAPLLLLSACATLTAEADQTVSIATEPAGAVCEARNKAGTWKSAPTPSRLTVTRDFSTLAIECIHPSGARGSTTLPSSVRNRAYGNILLGGTPAVIDAYNGRGYEYPEEAAITLSARPH